MEGTFEILLLEYSKISSPPSLRSHFIKNTEYMEERITFTVIIASTDVPLHRGYIDISHYRSLFLLSIYTLDLVIIPPRYNFEFSYIYTPFEIFNRITMAK